jgi:hypothetical protein
MCGQYPDAGFVPVGGGRSTTQSVIAEAMALTVEAIDRSFVDALALYPDDHQPDPTLGVRRLRDHATSDHTPSRSLFGVVRTVTNPAAPTLDEIAAAVAVPGVLDATPRTFVAVDPGAITSTAVRGHVNPDGSITIDSVEERRAPDPRRLCEPDDAWEDGPPARARRGHH